MNSERTFLFLFCFSACLFHTTFSSQQEGRRKLEKIDFRGIINQTDQRFVAAVAFQQARQFQSIGRNDQTSVGVASKGLSVNSAQKEDRSQEKVTHRNPLGKVKVISKNGSIRLEGFYNPTDRQEFASCSKLDGKECIFVRTKAGLSFFVFKNAVLASILNKRWLPESCKDASDGLLFEHIQGDNLFNKIAIWDEPLPGRRV